MPIHLHLLNARDRLGPLAGKIEYAFAEGIAFITELLPIANVDVVIQAGTYVIPETGMVGHSPAVDVLYLTIDPANPNLMINFETEFRATLGHELHHCARRSAVSLSKTLREALISEGLACHFETELRAGEVPFYARALKGQMLEDMHTLAHRELDDVTYNYAAWFYGSTELSIPRHTGYSLGFRIVGQQLGKSGLTASALWDAPCALFFETASDNTTLR